ncbi:MAG: DUF5658 family protein [Candidatus Dormibacteria bacterium]
MGAETRLEPRVRRVGVGIVEIVPDEVEEPSPRTHQDPSLATIRENMRNRVCALLVAIIAAAQVADVVTTYRALAGHWYVENNPLLRTLIVRSPLAAYSVKLLIIAATVVLVLSRLRGPRARAALTVAAAISLTAPLLNFNLLLHQ